MTYHIEIPNVDLHSHMWITTDAGRFRLPFDRKARDMISVLEAMEEGGINVSALTDTMDDRFLHVRDNIRSLSPRVRSMFELFDNAIIFDGKIVVFRGEEVHTDAGDLVVVGNKRKMHVPHKRLPLKDVVDYAFDNGLYVLAAHPFDKHDGLGEHLDEIVEKVDSLELNPNCSYMVKNFPLLDRRQANEKSRIYALEHKKPLTATSDSHFHSEVGRGYVAIRNNLSGDNPDEILSGIKIAVSDEQYKNHLRLASRWELNKLVLTTVWDLQVRNRTGWVYTPFEEGF